MLFRLLGQGSLSLSPLLVGEGFLKSLWLVRATNSSLFHKRKKMLSLWWMIYLID
jgi:hypothetical protein